MAKLTQKELSLLLKELSLTLETKFKNNFTGLVLFGSYAKNKQKKNSDIDLLIIFNKLPKNRYKRSDLIVDIIINFNEKYDIDLAPILAEEKKLSKSILLIEIADYSQILLDKNNRIKSLFNKIEQDYINGYIKKIIKEDYHIVQFENV